MDNLQKQSQTKQSLQSLLSSASFCQIANISFSLTPLLTLEDIYTKCSDYLSGCQNHLDTY